MYQCKCRFTTSCYNGLISKIQSVSNVIDGFLSMVHCLHGQVCNSWHMCGFVTLISVYVVIKGRHTFPCGFGRLVFSLCVFSESSHGKKGRRYVLCEHRNELPCRSDSALIRIVESKRDGVHGCDADL